MVLLFLPLFLVGSVVALTGVELGWHFIYTWKGLVLVVIEVLPQWLLFLVMVLVAVKFGIVVRTALWGLEVVSSI